MLCHSLSELCWFAARGHSASPSYEMLAISGCSLSAFPDVSRAPCMFLAPLQLAAGNAELLKLDWHREMGQGTWLAGGAGFKCLRCLYSMEELQRWLHMQTRLYFSMTEGCKGQR